MPLEFKNPEYFLILLLLIPGMILYYFKFSLKRKSTLKISSIKKIKRIKRSSSLRYRHIILALRLFAITCLLAALARPQTGKKNTIIRSETKY